MSTYLLKHKATLYTSSARVPTLVPAAGGAGGGDRGGDKYLGPHAGSLGPKKKRVPFGTRLRPESIRALKAVKAHSGHNLNEVIETALLDAKRIGWSPILPAVKAEPIGYRAPYATSLDPRMLAFLKALSQATKMAMNHLLERLIEVEFERLPEPAKYPNFLRARRRDQSDAEWEQEMIDLFGPEALEAPDII
jgi:hypothetical protein